MKLLNIFKGLTTEYFFRQLFFGTLFGIFFIYTAFQGESIKYDMIVMAVVSTILYPYSHFAYESIIEFILGDTIFIHNTLIFFIWKFITMVLCWSLAIFIAPVGLLFIYLYQKKQNKEKKV